jgi:hypothetical protein
MAPAELCGLLMQHVYAGESNGEEVTFGRHADARSQQALVTGV